jgi:hypothetical protein
MGDEPSLITRIENGIKGAAEAFDSSTRALGEATIGKPAMEFLDRPAHAVLGSIASAAIGELKQVGGAIDSSTRALGNATIGKPAMEFLDRPAHAVLSDTASAALSGIRHLGETLGIRGGETAADTACSAAPAPVKSPQVNEH